MLRGLKRGQINPQVYSWPQQRSDQITKTLLTAAEGRDGQVPMQEFLQQPEKQMITPESREHTTGRLEHHNSKVVDTISFKCNIMKVIESLKQDLKNSIKEMDEKTT